MPTYVRRIFWFVNKFFMVPLFRLGLGPLFGNPFSGYIMVLKAVGRKTGKVRFAPVNYAIHQGSVYCISGGRKTSDWYRNLLANPEIDVILPGGAIHGQVDEVTDPELRRLLIRKILQNAGFAGFFEGYNPFRISDEELLVKSADLPLLRIRPIGLGSGVSDPGGWAWVWSFIITIGIILLLVLR
jgi:deazaflavin-dependent oxidoreductase (nitroreductase family)